MATVRRHLPTIHRVHDNIGQPSPTASTLLRATMAGTVRVQAAPSKQTVPGRPGSFVSTASAAWFLMGKFFASSDVFVIRAFRSCL